MARNGKLELTWVASLRQWRKRHKGKTYYLGTGKGKSDRVAYRRALAKWNVVKAENDETERQIALEERRRELQDLSQRLHKLPIRFRRRLHAVNPAPLWRLKDGPASRNGGKKPQKTVNELLDLFIKAQEKRYERGQKFPNAPRKERISASRLMAIKHHTKCIRTAMGIRRLTDDEAELAQMMRDFRSEHDALVLDGTIKPNTFNERIKDLRQFIGWCHSNYYISTLPRNLAELCSKYQYEPSPKAIDIKTIKRLWAAATLRGKCWIALGLNLGYYACDIATLESDHTQSQSSRTLTNSRSSSTDPVFVGVGSDRIPRFRTNFTHGFPTMCQPSPVILTACQFSLAKSK